jgi:hypothetical protein
MSISHLPRSTVVGQEWLVMQVVENFLWRSGQLENKESVSFQPIVPEAEI